MSCSFNEAMMVFKKWTPKGLIKYYYAERLCIDGTLRETERIAEERGEKLTEKSLKELREELETQKKDETALILKLGTDEEMCLVWRKLLKRSNRHERNKNLYQDRDECETIIIAELVTHIQLAIYESKKYHSKRQEDINKYLSIANSANELLRALYKTSLDTTVYRWYSPEIINAIIENDLKPEKLSGYASYIHDEDGITGLRKGDIFREDIDDYGMGMAEYIPSQMFFEHFVITAHRPVMSEILKNLVADAQKLAEETKVEPRIVERTSIAPTSIFIRKLYKDFWLNEFGGVLSGTFAALCRVVLENPEINEDTVKSAIKDLRV